MKQSRIRDSLRVTIPARKFFDNKTDMFIDVPETSITLVHSLLSISVWESKWHKAFLSDNYEKTPEMIRDYIRCMTVGPEPDPLVYVGIPASVMHEIEQYIGDPMCATYLRDPPDQPHNREVVTAELLYYQMRTLNIWLECEKWHLNRLLMLIKVTQRKEEAANKKGGMSNKGLAKSNAHLNRSRKHH